MNPQQQWREALEGSGWLTPHITIVEGGVSWQDWPSSDPFRDLRKLRNEIQRFTGHDPLFYVVGTTARDLLFAHPDTLDLTNPWGSLGVPKLWGPDVGTQPEVSWESVDPSLAAAAVYYRRHLEIADYRMEPPKYASVALIPNVCQE